MRKILKWVGLVLVSLVGLVILVAVGLSVSTNARVNKEYVIKPEPVVIPTDAASIEEGGRLTAIYCAGCHGEDFGGTDFFNDPALAVVDATNLTAGSGGIGGVYSDEDWVRSIRNGVGSDGRPLFIMPSADFHFLGKEDLAQIIAYLKTVPPVDNESNDRTFGFMGKVLLGLGAFGDVISVETIDHDMPFQNAPTAGNSPEYGAYLVNTFGCRTCHGPQLSGGKDPNPDAPEGPNLTPGGNLGGTKVEAFITMVRSRSSQWMPFESLATMSDDELTAIWNYLQSLPALETSN